MKKLLAGSLIAFGALLASNSLVAQKAPAPATKQTEEDKEIAAMRKEMRAQRKAYIANVLKLTPAEDAKFWPVYDQYVAELMKIGDQRLALLKTFAEKQDTATGEQALKWVTELTKQDQAITALRAKYIPIVAKVLPGKKAAQFVAVDRRTEMMVELDLPLK